MGTIDNRYKTILWTLAFFVIGVVLAFFIEDYYRQLVRFSFKLLNSKNIQFIGKNFHLFASNTFVAAFGLFTSLTFLFLRFSPKVKRAFLTVVIFFVTTVLITALDSIQMVLECTSCYEGIRRLTYNELAYDRYFIISLTTPIAYLLVAYLLEVKSLSMNKSNLVSNK